MIANKTPDQIIRMDATGCMLEILNSSLDGYGKGKMGKVALRFSQYDENNKQTGLIKHYIDIPKFLGLIDDVRFGRMKQLANIERAAVANREHTYPQPIWKDFKTTDRSVLKANAKSRPDGLDEVRTFDISPSTKAKTPSYMVTALICAGDKDDKGNIVQKINYKDPATYQKITITIPESDFRDALIYVEMHIQAFFNRKWMQGTYDTGNSNNKNAPATNTDNETDYRQQQPQAHSNNGTMQQNTQTPSGPTAKINQPTYAGQQSSGQKTQNSQYSSVEITDEEEFPFSSAN